MATRTIPAFLVEYFLLGRTRAAAPEQFFKDGGITTDVWLDFADDLDTPARVLIAPADGVGAAELGYALHQAIKAGRVRRQQDSAADKPGISPLEDYVRARVTLDDLLEDLLPLTAFYCSNRLDRLQHSAAEGLPSYAELMRREICRRLGHAGPSQSVIDSEMGCRSALKGEEARTDREQRRGINAAAPAAALIGLIAALRDGKLAAVRKGQKLDLASLDPGKGGDASALLGWMRHNAPRIAAAAVEALSRISVVKDEDLAPPTGTAALQMRDDREKRRQPLIWRIFIDREARLSHREAICTVKADAAQLLFEISCKTISWAIIDSGVAAVHPAFLDHARKRQLPPAANQKAPSRVRGTYDFTKINRIRNFDLIEGDEDEAVDTLIEDLKTLPVTRPAEFEEKAPVAIKGIIAQLRLGLKPHWQTVEPLIAIEPDDGAHLCSDHGTHVAGTLGGDWRDEEDKPLLRGMCPDINLYDLRVIPYPGQVAGGARDQLFATESAVLAALEFVQHLNSRTMVRTQIIHGVNISMSIPHDVRNYGCGATPVCVACDRLVNSGVMVVAAAGNRGWEEQEHGFGQFVLSSITDPGNARNVITVGSTHPRKPHIYGISYFSSRGPTGDGRAKPDLVAPGEGIVAPIRNESEAELSGTSMAAPFVSGAAAMVMARHPEMVGAPLEVKAALCRSATDLERERSFQGHGLLDVLRAIQSR